MSPRRPTLPPALPVRRAPGSRIAPPASPGLPPSRRRFDSRAKRRRKYPTKDKPKAQQTQALMQAAAEVLTKGTPAEEAAVHFGVDASGRTVKELVKSARALFARRAEFYVEAHAQATLVAAGKGDASPAEWALERIAEAGERIVDPPKADMGRPAAVSIGIQLGGMPSTAHQTVDAELVTPAELPRLETPKAADVPAELMP